MQLFVLDPGRGGQHLEKRRHGPCAQVDLGIDVVGQDARDVIDQATAGDVGDALDLDLGADFPDVRQVERVGAEQFLAERTAHALGMRLKTATELVEKNFPRERITVRVQAGRGQADDHVAGTDRFAVDDFGAVDHADDGADQIVIRTVIDAGHLRGFAADEGAAGLFAAADHPGDELLKAVRLQALGGHVIEEEKRLGPKNGDVVDAMVDQVLADGVVLVHEHGHLQFGADAIDAGDKHRVLHPGKFRAEESAETSDFTEHFRTVGRFDEGRNAGLDLVTKINIDTGAGVSFQAITHEDAQFLLEGGPSAKRF